MNKVKEKPNPLLEWAKKWKWWIFHTISILIMLIIAALGTWDAYHYKHLIGEGRPITLEYLVGFLVTIATIYLFAWRAVNQEKQTDNQTKQIEIQAQQLDRQIKKEIEDRFTAADKSLGSDQTSARTNAVYSLYQQAVEHKKYREQIAHILCSHIRSKTQESEYQKQHKDRPSNEIQTTIDLLFKETGKKGLYPQFRKELPNANLSYAYCVGANFEGADCQGANFEEANCQGANFEEADCQIANFEGARCQRTHFRGGDCQGANFGWAHCQKANFGGAHCQEASFNEAHCQGASFMGADCQGVNFRGASCQIANFMRASCQGAIFMGTSCEGVDFKGASFQGADFEGIFCQGTDFRGADCQRVDFRNAYCQGANFEGTRCQETDFNGTNFQGAYSSHQSQSLQSRIGKNTELALVLEGALSEQSIDAIEKAELYCSPNWYAGMQKMIEANKGKEEKSGTPKGIISGILEDSEEIQTTIKLLEYMREGKIF